MEQEELNEENIIDTIPGDQVMGDALDDIGQDQEYGEEEKLKPETKYPRPLPPAPKIFYEEPPEIPVELSGVGVNKKVITKFFFTANYFIL